MPTSDKSATALTGWDRRRTLRLTEYEHTALTLFAERGFRDVTIDDIAEVAGVSARTLFRYFPTKEDFLLGRPRRGAERLVASIAVLAPSDSPERAAWEVILQGYDADPPDAKSLNLWRAAAVGAPEVVARVTGERLMMVYIALAAYFARCLGVDVASDPTPRVMAGSMVGVELALIETLGRSTAEFPEIVEAANRALHVRPRRSDR